MTKDQYNTATPIMKSIESLIALRLMLNNGRASIIAVEMQSRDVISSFILLPDKALERITQQAAHEVGEEIIKLENELDLI